MQDIISNKVPKAGVTRDSKPDLISTGSGIRTHNPRRVRILSPLCKPFHHTCIFLSKDSFTFELTRRRYFIVCPSLSVLFTFLARASPAVVPTPSTAHTLSATHRYCVNTDTLCLISDFIPVGVLSG